MARPDTLMNGGTFATKRERSTLRLRHGVGAVAVGAALVVVAWLIVATVYIVYHDPLLGALMARQTSMQYAYEDQIAALKSQVDEATARNNAAGTALDTLAALGARLEQRAQALEALAVASAEKAAPANASSTVSQAAQPVPSRSLPDANAGTAPVIAPQPAGSRAQPALRLDDKEADAVPASVTTPRDRIALLEASFATLEARQAREAERLRDPVMRRVARLRNALAEAGMPAPRSSLGGPFVPLPAAAAGSRFDEQATLLAQAIVMRDDLSKRAARLPLRRPVEGSLEVTSPFGARLDPFLGRPALHTGVDLFERAGDRVTATAAGVVTIAGADGGYGNMVEIDHGNGLVTRYAHLASIEVAVHQNVAAGTVVGLVGSTGRATGPHLHYETRIDGVPVDPARFLKASYTLYPSE